ncbi:hypothetical protein CDAR_290151 [Caerostris darwini]|uniref:Uncharacterized protein n=1 Tax=Caerostris darwini TaxID=1538125 RepID=A0AAV4SPM5_9ARAC|nr:hypothetical protein CDAR_290151 [Caerostris darwini]
MRAPRCGAKRTSRPGNHFHLPMSHLRATRRRISPPPRPLKRKELKIGPFEVSPTNPRFPGGFPPTAKGVYLPNFSFFLRSPPSADIASCHSSISGTFLFCMWRRFYAPSPNGLFNSNRN